LNDGACDVVCQVRPEIADRPDLCASAHKHREVDGRAERRECAPREAKSRSRSVRYPERPAPAVASAASSLAVPPPGRCLRAWWSRHASGGWLGGVVEPRVSWSL